MAADPACVRSPTRHATTRRTRRQRVGPFGPTLLGPAQAAILTDGPLSVDLSAHEVTTAAGPLSLTSREYDLLVFFLQHPRQAFSREELLKRVWGWEYADHSTVTVHVRRLREKVEADPRNPVRVVTVFGVGYRYEPQELA